MPDDNRFEGLGDALDEDDHPEETDDTDTTMTETTTTEADTTAEPTTTDDPQAFPYEATAQKSLYVRPESWDDLDGAMSLAEAKLKTEDGETNVTTSELHDAVARLAAENPDELRRLVREAREE